MGVILFVLANALLVLAAGSATALLRPESRLDAALMFCVCAIAAIETVELVAGITGHLEASGLTGLVAICAVSALALGARSGVVLHPRLRRPRVRWALIRHYPWELAVVSLGVLALAWQLLIALVMPPYAYDALGYHLTIVGSWLEAANISPTKLAICCARYPANAELMFAWPAVLLHSDAVVDAVQVAFAAFGALAVAGMARSAGLARAQSAAAGALFAVTPIVLTQAPTAFVDVIIASTTLAALHFAIRFAITRQRRLLIPAGLATGFVFGTKGIGPIWGLALTCVVTGILLMQAQRRRTSWHAVASGAGGFILLCALLGSFWYVRNWVDTGNPIYPFRVTVLGDTVWNGPESLDSAIQASPDQADIAWPLAVAHSWAGDIAFWDQTSYDYQQRRGGLGPVWVWLGLPLLVPVGFVLVRHRNPASMLAIIPCAVLIIQPFRWWSRFTIPLAAAGAVSVVYAATRVPRPWMARSVRTAAFGLGAVAVILSSYQVNPASQARPISALRVVQLATEPDSDRTLGRLFFPEYRFLDAVPNNATMIVDLDAAPIRFSSPFFGPRFTRHLLPANGAFLEEATWVVTARGRPLDGQLRQLRRWTLVSDERGIRVWHSGRPPEHTP